MISNIDKTTNTSSQMANETNLNDQFNEMNLNDFIVPKKKKNNKNKKIINTANSNTADSNIIESNIVESNIVESNAIKSNIVESNIVKSNIVESNIIESNIVESNNQLTQINNKSESVVELLPKSSTKLSTTKPSTTKLSTTKPSTTKSSTTKPLINKSIIETSIKISETIIDDFADTWIDDVDEKLVDEKLIDEKLVDEKLVNEKSVDEKPINDNTKCELNQFQQVKQIEHLEQIEMIKRSETNQINQMNQTGQIKKMSAFDRLVNERNGYTDNMPTIIRKSKEELIQQGTRIIAKLEEKKICIDKITPDIIISEWTDILSVCPNSNESYLMKLIQGIQSYGFESPRPIQSATIGRIAIGGDLIAQAKAGHGKTGAFVIGALSSLNPKLNKVQLLILSPTGILTDQTYEIVCKIAKKTNIIVRRFHGGIYDPDTKKTSITAHVVVGCPGRIGDMLKNNNLDLSQLKALILDEGDELLKPCFKDQTKYIVEELNNSTQICLFSATLPKNVLELCQRFMCDPSYVIVPDNEVVTEAVSQYYVNCSSIEYKNGCVKDIIENNLSETIIIFCNTCTGLIKLANLLTERDKHFLQIHSRMDKADRDKSINDFRDGKVRILLSSDVAARGIDIPRISVVVNYDMPLNIETYIHRIGRSGRGDKLGKAVSLILSESDIGMKKCICEVHSQKISELKYIELNKNNR